MKKTWFPLILAGLCALALSACTSTADTMESPSPSPSASATVQPTQSAMPTQSAQPTASEQPAASPSGGVTTLEDAVRVSGELVTELQKLSEVKDAVAVTAGSLAIVGVEFDTQYQGGVTERIIGMVEQRATAVDTGLTSVAVTDDPALVEQLRKLAEQAEQASITFAELQTQALSLGTEIQGATSPSQTQGDGMGA